MLKSFFSIIAFFGAAQSFAQVYCLTENYLALENPVDDSPKNEKGIPWIVFHINKNDPAQSSVEKIYVADYCTSSCESKPKLFNLDCFSDTMTFFSGTLNGSQQFFYKVSDKETKLQIKEDLNVPKEALKVFYEGQSSVLKYSSPLIVKLKNGSSFKFEQKQSEIKKLGAVSGEEKFTASLISTDGKSLKNWDLWKKSWEEIECSH